MEEIAHMVLHNLEKILYTRQFMVVLKKVQYVRFLVGNIQNYQQEGDSSVNSVNTNTSPAT